MSRARAGLILLAALALAAAAFIAAGELLSAPARWPVGAPPPGLHARPVLLPTALGEPVAGWFAAGTRGGGAVLLLHGVRSDRRQMAARALALGALGYAVLLIDLPAHGESPGARITFGWREAEGVKAALAWLRREQPGERIGVIGVSLGAASTVLAQGLPRPDALVLESMYPSIAEAVEDRLRMRLGPAAGRLITPLLLWQLPWRLDVAPAQLRPIDHMATLGAPVLIVSGAEDQHTTRAETARLYEAARAPKALWVVPGAAHVDLHAFDAKAYEARVFPFLAQYLRKVD